MLKFSGAEQHMTVMKDGTVVDMENCHVAAKLDVYNDVCGNYQYYWYRYSGMLIGRVRNTVQWNGYDIPDLKYVTARNCTVNFGDWNDYYYCEIEANTQASYTEDYQMSRLTKVKSVAGNVVTYLDNTTETITGESYRHFVVVPDSNNPENATCYHFKDGEVYTHTANEDKQHVYLPFNQLFTGTGWGIRGIDIDDLGIGGIEIEDRVDVEQGEDESVYKFESKSIDDNIISKTRLHAVGDLFKYVAPVELPVNTSSVMVSINSAENGEIAGTYTPDSSDWTKGTIEFREDFEGRVKITIQDYQFCTPTILYLYVSDDIIDVIYNFNNEVGNTNVGTADFNEFLTKQVNLQ